VVLRLTDPQLARTLREAADVQLALSIPELAGPAFVAALFGERVRSVFSVGDRLLAVVDLVAYPDDPLFSGKSLADLQETHRFIALAVRRGEQMIKPPFDSHPVQTGDRMTVILSLVDLQRLLRQEKVPP
jgi:Trk K+ transport system NAD-binding subunit